MTLIPILTLTLAPLIFGSQTSQAQAQAQTQADTNVQVFKHKLSCFHDYLALETSNGETRKVEFNRMSNESLRTTWKTGNVEHRFSDWKIFVYLPDGVVQEHGRTVATVKTEQKNGFLLETGTETRYSYMADSSRVKPEDLGVKVRTKVFSTKFKVNGNTETVVEAIVNQQMDPFEVGTIRVRDEFTRGYHLTIVEKTPYKYTGSAGESIEVLRSIWACQFENVD